MNIELYKLDKDLKKFLLVFLIVLTFGFSTGLVFIYQMTNMTPQGSITNLKGSQILSTEENFDIPEKYAKPLSEMLLTTHTHIISFSLIFFLVGLIFYFNTIITGFNRILIMLIPLISVLITFSSMWAIRYLSEKFVYLSIITGFLEYSAFYIMIGTIIYELKFKRNYSASKTQRIK